MSALALTIRQPWAWAIAAGLKTVENRSWATKYRGPLYVHAGAKLDPRELSACSARLRAAGLSVTPPPLSSLAAGALIAVVDLVDCGRFCDDPWADRAVGVWHFKLANVRTLPEPIPVRGALGLWRVQGV